MYYYINKNQQPSGDFEVHRSTGCPHPAAQENRISLGNWDNCHQAVQEAKRRFSGQKSHINGCYWCCNPCHTT